MIFVTAYRSSPGNNRRLFVNTDTIDCARGRVKGESFLLVTLTSIISCRVLDEAYGAAKLDRRGNLSINRAWCSKTRWLGGTSLNNGRKGTEFDMLSYRRKLKRFELNRIMSDQP